MRLDQNSIREKLLEPSDCALAHFLLGIEFVGIAASLALRQPIFVAYAEHF
jgi:hypothetical protein